MISYYELLGMIKENKAPNKIKVHLTSTPKIYKKDDDTEEYCFYVIDDDEETNENYKYYLNESYLESMMFEENIEILDENRVPKKINKSYKIRILDLDNSHTIKEYDLEQLIEMVQDIYDKQVEIIDYLQRK